MGAQTGWNVVLSYGDLSHQGGYRSRVLGELTMLDGRSGLDPFLLVFDRNPGGFEKSFSEDVRHCVLDRSSPLGFYSAIAALAREKPIRLVHAHNLYSAALALSLRWRYGYKVLLDYHGRIPEEYVFLGKGGPLSRKALEVLERWTVRSADHVAVVSQKLADYLVERYPIAPGRISVVPCCADETIFTWDAARRDALRQSMKLSGKFVCTHLGSFFEWYDPAMIHHVFQQIRKKVESHLLVITAETENARKYLSERLPADTFTVRQAAHSEVPGLLNAADAGFLLLRPSPNIKTSSPAKFAEYLNCGLPVLISPDVGDFSEMVAQKGVGAIVSKDGAVDAEFIEHVGRNRGEMASRCVAAGSTLTWQALAETWSRIVSAG